MIRVLIADDSPTIRRYLKILFSCDSELAVVGEAENGAEAVELCRNKNPDIITMDVGMPVMDGLEATRIIMAEMPRPILVMTSTLSDIETGASLKAAAAGALMVMGKPHGMPWEDPEAEEAIRLVKALSRVKVFKRKKNEDPLKKKPVIDDGRGREYEIVAIGASTGGPQALYEILSGMPADFVLPILVVQHISSGFINGFARWLNDSSRLKVKVAQDGENIRAGHVYIAPENRHLGLKKKGVISVFDGDKVDGHKPSATVLLESVADFYGAGAIGAVLTGMGSDGAKGLLALRRAGGYTIAQDEKSSIIFGMPKAAIAIGAAKDVLPLSEVPLKLVELCKGRKYLRK